jgi:hypothetical protein
MKSSGNQLLDKSGLQYKSLFGVCLILSSGYALFGEKIPKMYKISPPRWALRYSQMNGNGI